MYQQEEIDSILLLGEVRLADAARRQDQVRLSAVGPKPDEIHAHLFEAGPFTAGYIPKGEALPLPLAEIKEPRHEIDLIDMGVFSKCFHFNARNPVLRAGRRSRITGVRGHGLCHIFQRCLLTFGFR